MLKKKQNGNDDKNRCPCQELNSHFPVAQPIVFPVCQVIPSQK